MKDYFGSNYHAKVRKDSSHTRWSLDLMKQVPFSIFALTFTFSLLVQGIEEMNEKGKVSEDAKWQS